MIFFITQNNKVKQFYKNAIINNEMVTVVYDRDSSNGLSILKNPKRIFDESSNNFNELSKSFFNHIANIDLNLKRYIIALWNNDVLSYSMIENDLELELEMELRHYLDNEIACRSFDVDFLRYIKEKYYFQRKIPKFNENWLKDYNGEYAGFEDSETICNEGFWI